MIYDLWIINHHRWFNDLKSLESNLPKFDLRFRFIIQLSSDLNEHWTGQLPPSTPLDGTVHDSVALE